MKVAQVIASIREEASGPSYSVPRLCASLARCGVTVSLHVLAAASERPLTACSYALRVHPVGRMMHRTYLWLLGGGAPPDWVRTDG